MAALYRSDSILIHRCIHDYFHEYRQPIRKVERALDRQGALSCPLLSAILQRSWQALGVSDIVSWLVQESSLFNLPEFDRKGKFNNIHY